MAARLPVELHELIIDFAHDETLRNTSLVCKPWLTRSRYNIFRVVELCIPAHLDRLMNLLVSAPHIAPYIQEISISENSLLALLRPTMAIVARLPHSLSAHPLVRPNQLTVHHQLWLPTRYHPDYLLSLSQLSSLTTLDLFDVTFATVFDFAIILCALPGLQVMNAIHLECQRNMDPRTEASAGCELRFLTSLHVASEVPTSAVDWLFRCNRFPALRSAHITYELSAADVNQGIGTFLASTGATLENLSLMIPPTPIGRPLAPEVLEHQLDMACCTALRTLRVDCRYKRQITPDLEWLIWLLKHLPRNTSVLRTIVLTFQDSSHALAILHPDLDAALGESSFSATLNSVIFEFDVRAPAGRGGDERVIMGRFPTLGKKGLLQVRYNAL